ncbi:MAG: hypothetical protein IKZ28_02540, partial [Clostridia bacterium]|nr:hypothetical protein [Clostridia bacterium]
LYWKEKVNPGMVAGLLNGFCYLGSAASSYGLGLIADAWNWSAVFWTLFVLSVLSAAVGLIYALITRKKQ